MNGFTLIETIIAIAVLALVMASITAFILNTYDIYYYDLAQSDAIEEAKKGVEVMIKDIRRADMAEDGAYVIESAQDFQFTFYSDIDRDDAVEKVRYFIEGSQFKKGIINPVGAPAVYPPGDEQIFIISSFVRNTPPVFRYFDGDGVELPAPARKRDTKLMRLTLEIDVNPDEPPTAFTLISETQIRNLKTNL